MLLVSKISLPETLTIIQAGAFGGLKGLKSIKLPNGVESLKAYLFYGCTQLKKITLPKNLAAWDSMAIVDCPKLQELSLPAENHIFSINDGCVIVKKDQTLICACFRAKTLKIPNGVKVIRKYALSNALSNTVNIPASVICTEGFL